MKKLFAFMLLLTLQSCIVQHRKTVAAAQEKYDRVIKWKYGYWCNGYAVYYPNQQWNVGYASQLPYIQKSGDSTVMYFPKSRVKANYNQ